SGLMATHRTSPVCPRKVNRSLGSWADRRENQTRHPRVMPSHTACFPTTVASRGYVILHLHDRFRGCATERRVQQLAHAGGDPELDEPSVAWPDCCSDWIGATNAPLPEPATTTTSRSGPTRTAEAPRRLATQGTQVRPRTLP